MRVLSLVFLLLCGSFGFRGKFLSRPTNPFSNSKIWLSQSSAKKSELLPGILLWRLPNSPVSIKSTVVFLHSWGLEIGSTSGAIRVTPTSRGVKFGFGALPGSTLELTVVADKDDGYKLGLDVQIYSRFNIGLLQPRTDDKKNRQMQSLVKFAADNIIDSFNNEIGELLMTKPVSSVGNEQRNGDEDQEPVNTINVVDEDDIDMTKIEAIKDWPGYNSNSMDVDKVSELMQSAWVSSTTPTQSRDTATMKPNSAPIPSSTSDTPASNINDNNDDDDDDYEGVATSVEGDLDMMGPFLSQLRDGRGAVNSAQRASQSVADSNLRRMLKQQQMSGSQAQLQEQVAKKEPALRMDKFKDRGIEEQAIEELNRMVDNSRKEGFAEVLSTIKEVNITNESTAGASSSDATGTVMATSTLSLLKQGREISSTSIQELLSRPSVIPEDLSIPVTKFPIDLAAGGLKGGIDIFEGPPIDPAYVPPSSALGKQMAAEKTQREANSKGNTTITAEASLDMTVPDMKNLNRDMNRLELLILDLGRLPGELHDDVLQAFRDLMLCDNFLFMMKAANATVSDQGTRRILGVIAIKASELNLELGALVRTESVRHLETITQICEVSALYQDNEGEFLDRLDLLRPKFDSNLLGYLKFAIGEEEALITAKGSDYERFPTQWLQVLRVVQRGVRADIERRFDRLLEPILLTLRFTDPELQENIFKRFINITADVDMYYMRNLCCNLVEGMVESVKNGEFDKTIAPLKPSASESSSSARNQISPEGRRMLRHLKHFNQLIEKHLNESIVKQRFAQVEQEAAEQGQEIIMRHRNPLMQQEMDMYEEREKERLAELAGSSLLDRKRISSGGTREEEI